ncbi:alpha/beta hydrolase [Leucobacter sp. NPDC015123]|uniref:alpha/beta hydrolase n=1 Tax=Leucobacter sp. NPDC015123 TaxID=3364129 RepID=UPI0036F47889
MTTHTHTPPPFDSELAAALTVLGAALPTGVLPDAIPMLREMPVDPALHEQIAASGATREDHVIPGFEGAEIEVSIFRNPSQSVPGPGILHLHGGGMIAGNRFMGVDGFLPLLRDHGAVIVSVEYRLAPEFPDPVPVEDAFAGLLWMAEHASELGIDADRLIVAGASAGGGLAAGVTLLARDRNGPKLLASLLIYPMIDDRNDTVSAQQFEGIGVWDRTSNYTGWNALLGERRGGPDVSAYAAPARASDLSGLPPTFIDVGSAEVFRDENVAYATAIWAAGGECELHVWPGGFHGFDAFASHAQLSREMVKARNAWLNRMLER